MKRLSFVSREFTGKTYVWDVFCSNAALGQVRWYAPWRRYCFMPATATVFDASCLSEIVEFIGGQMERRKMAVGCPLREEAAMIPQ